MIAGLGLDIVEVASLEDGAESCLTAAETEYCRGMRRPGPFVAARLAAKRALFRALGVEPGSDAWLEVEVVRDDAGRPSLSAAGSVAKALRAAGVARVHLSLTHTDEQAAAAVVLEADGASG